MNSNAQDTYSDFAMYFGTGSYYSNLNIYIPIDAANQGGWTETLKINIITSKNYSVSMSIPVNITIGDIYNEQSCFPAGTLVTIVVYEEDEKGKKKRKLKKKKIEDVTYDDLLLVWNFDKGCFDEAKPIWIMKEQKAAKYNHIKFSNGSEIKTINQHRVYNVDKESFTYAMLETEIGTRVFSEDGIVTITSKEVIEEGVTYYNIITNRHINMFANGILTSCRLNNMYPIKDMKFVKDNRELIPIEYFEDIDKEMYEGLRLGEQPKKENCKTVIFTKDLIGYVKNIMKLKK